MKDDIESILKLKLNENFYKILEKFCTHFDSIENGLNKFTDYINCAYITNFHLLRYVRIPFEAQLPFSTGCDGIHLGWLNMSPEDSSFKKPFVAWSPYSQLYYFGSEEKEYIQNCMTWPRKNEYLDLSFLKSIGINPEKGISPILIKQEEEVSKIDSLIVQPNQLYQMAPDGVGVLADKKYFEAAFTKSDISKDPTENLMTADVLMRKNKYASSLILLKYNFFSSQIMLPKELNIRTIEKIIACYKALNKCALAERAQSDLELINSNNLPYH